MCQMCQMLNIWHTKHQKTVANLQQCGHKCQTRKIIFYSTFLSRLNSSFDFSLSFQNCLSQVPNSCSSFYHNRTRARSPSTAQKKAAVVAKRGGKAVATSSKLVAASDLQNGAKKLGNGVEALLISNLSL